MNGNDFIRLAGRLVAPPGADEASCRTAVSRAYYGAFHAARSFLEELGFSSVRNANVHAFVRHYLAGSNHPEAARAASELAHLQGIRNLADYQLDDPETSSREYAMVIVERATRVVSSINRCRVAEVKASMQRAISEYEQKLRPR